MILWGLTAVGIFVGYRLSKRHTRVDYLSLFQKLQHVDAAGFGLLTTGLTIFLTGLNLGGGLCIGTNSRVLGILVAGLVILVSFGIYVYNQVWDLWDRELFRSGISRSNIHSLYFLHLHRGHTVLFVHHLLPCSLSTPFSPDENGTKCH